MGGLALVLVALGAGAAFHALRPRPGTSTFTTPPEITALERAAWNDLDQLLLGLSVDNPLKLEPHGAKIGIAGTSADYARNSPTALSNIMGEWAGSRLEQTSSTFQSDTGGADFEKIVGQRLFDESEGLESIGVLTAHPGRLRLAAAQHAVLGFLFAVADEVELAEGLAARSMACEAVARAGDRSLRRVPALEALQYLACGRPDEADQALGADASPISQTLRDYIHTSCRSAPENSDDPLVIFRLLTRRRDGRPIKLRHLGRLTCDDSHGGGILTTSILVPSLGVSKGHGASQAAFQGAINRAANILGISSAMDPFETLAQISNALGHPAESDPLREALVHAWIRQGILARHFFLAKAFASPEATQQFLARVQTSLGKSDPLIEALTLESPQLNEDDVDTYGKLIHSMPTLSLKVRNLEVLEAVDEARAKDVFRSVIEAPTDSNIARLRMHRSMDRRMNSSEAAMPYWNAALAIDAWNPALYTSGDDLLLDSGFARLPGSYRLLRAKLSRQANELIASETGISSAISLLESGTISLDEEPDLLNLLANYQMKLCRHHDAITTWNRWLARDEDGGLPEAGARMRIGGALLELGARDSGMALLEECARSYAEWALLPLAYASEHFGSMETAGRIFADCAERYPQGEAWVHLAEFYSRHGQESEAQRIYRSQMPSLPNAGRVKDVVTFLYRINPDKISWLYGENIIPQKRARDFGAFALSRYLCGDRQSALRILSDAERADRLDEANAWLKFILLLDAKDRAGAMSFLEGHYGIFDEGRHRIFYAVARGDSRPEEVLELHRGMPDEKDYLAVLLPIAGFLAKADGDAAAASRWLNMACRLDHETRLLVATRHACGLKAGNWWLISEPRASFLRKSGLPSYIF